MDKLNEIDIYVAGFPVKTQEILEQIRETIKKAAPDAEEVISYKMLAYKLNGILVYFAAYKNHIGFYPTGKGIEAFKNELTKYNWSKGTIQFPLNKPIPFGLITKIVTFRVKENLQKAKKK